MVMVYSMEVKVNRNCLLVVYGPAKLYVKEGMLLATGYFIGEGDDVLVRSERGAAFYAVEATRLELVGGARTSTSIYCDESLTSYINEWMKVTKQVKSTSPRRILVLGGIDTGKTTLATWLYNMLEKPILEADIGQNELGTPCAMSLAEYRGKPTLSMQDKSPCRVWFIGHVSAERVLHKIIHTVHLVSKEYNDLIIDTDGYVKGKGLMYKLAIAEAIEADTIIVLGDIPSRMFRHITDNIYLLPVPKTIKKRSVYERRLYRERQYYNLFSSGKVVTFRISETSIVNVDIEALKHVKGYKQRIAGVIAALRRRGQNGYDTLCIIDSIDVDKDRLTLKCSRMFEENLSARTPIIEFGYVKLDKSYREVEKYDAGIYPDIIVRRG